MTKMIAFASVSLLMSFANASLNCTPYSNTHNPQVTVQVSKDRMTVTHVDPKGRAIGTPQVFVVVANNETGHVQEIEGYRAGAKANLQFSLLNNAGEVRVSTLDNYFKAALICN